MKLLSYAQPKYTGTWIRSFIGRRGRYDATKIETELDLTLRDWRIAVQDTVQDGRD